MMIKGNTELMHEVIEKMEYMVRIMDADHRVVYMNKKMRKLYGHTMGHYCYELLNNGERCAHCITIGAKYTGQPDSKDVKLGDQYYRIMSSPVNIGDNRCFSIEFFHDVTEEKRMEDELLKHYEKLKEDIEFAKHIQCQALPSDGVYWDAFKTNSLYVQSEDLGGDLFDIVKIDDEKSLIYISDVSGHGIKSSLLTIFLRQVIRGTKTSHNDVNSILDELLKNYNDLNVGDEQYLTILAGVYDHRLKTITFANGGHNCYPILIKGNEVQEIKVNGIPICSLMSEAAYETVTVPLEKGDRLVLYTDGISEAYNKLRHQEFGSEGILNVIRQNITSDGNVLAEKVVEEAKEFSEASLNDDMAILVVEFL